MNHQLDMNVLASGTFERLVDVLVRLVLLSRLAEKPFHPCYWKPRSADQIHLYARIFLPTSVTITHARWILLGGKSAVPLQSGWNRHGNKLAYVCHEANLEML